MDVNRRKFLLGLGTTVGTGALLSAGVPKKLIQDIDGEPALIKIASDAEIAAYNQSGALIERSTTTYAFEIPGENATVHAMKMPPGMWHLSIQQR
jgi:hypothetical protein